MNVSAGINHLVVSFRHPRPAAPDGRRGRAVDHGNRMSHADAIRGHLLESIDEGAGRRHPSSCRGIPSRTAHSLPRRNRPPTRGDHCTLPLSAGLKRCTAPVRYRSRCSFIQAIVFVSPSVIRWDGVPAPAAVRGRRRIRAQPARPRSPRGPLSFVVGKQTADRCRAGTGWSWPDHRRDLLAGPRG